MRADGAFLFSGHSYKSDDEGAAHTKLGKSEEHTDEPSTLTI